jgi:hypothetical protein
MHLYGTTSWFYRFLIPGSRVSIKEGVIWSKAGPTAWFQRLSTFLTNNGFICSRADPSLFVFKKDSCIMYLLVYVDDLILTGNDERVLRKFITCLNSEFAIKDLGLLIISLA